MHIISSYIHSWMEESQCSIWFSFVTFFCGCSYFLVMEHDLDFGTVVLPNFKNWFVDLFSDKKTVKSGVPSVNRNIEYGGVLKEYEENLLPNDTSVQNAANVSFLQQNGIFIVSNVILYMYNYWPHSRETRHLVASICPSVFLCSPAWTAWPSMTDMQTKTMDW